MSLIPKDIKKHFPIFQSNPDLIFLDNASTTQTPQLVIDKLNDYYTNYNANVHRGIYQIGEKATYEYESVRQKVIKFLNCDDSFTAIFTQGTTESINLLSNSLPQLVLKEGDEILISEMEHHSNIVPWQLACKRFNVKLKYIPITTEGEWDLSNLNQLITKKTKIVSLIHQSNVFGTINPIQKVTNIAKSLGATVIIDAAQSVPHSKIDIKTLNCDFLVFSGHKMLGPTGVGVLIGKTNLLDKMPPYMSGGDMINTVSMEESTWNELPWKFEAGTPNIAQVIGLGSSIDYLLKIGMDNIYRYEKSIFDLAIEKLSKVEGFKIFGNPKVKGSVISFELDGVHPHDLAQILDEKNIAVRAGHHCAQPIMEKLKVSATLRASFYIYNTEKDIDQLVRGIVDAREFFTF
ncbi:MAG: cysteine desulfurase [Candidatus Marinimicrobia bacterium]|nr:cysteine desulfurase [Candidatus Neomarinimicrobiota bacterium]|tara:strand:- start:1381 stop:2595 length:1215 start_codon:yes stop_codon:yes gene_type:complete